MTFVIIASVGTDIWLIAVRNQTPVSSTTICCDTSLPSHELTVSTSTTPAATTTTAAAPSTTGINQKLQDMQQQLIDLKSQSAAAAQSIN